MARTEADCSKSSSSKAAGESKPEAYPQGYVEDFDESRTLLEDFFSTLLDGGFEEAKLPFLGASQGNGVAFSKAGIAVLAWRTGGGVQHAIKTQIGEAIGRDVFPNLFDRVAGGNEFFPGGRIDAVEAGRDDRRRTDAHVHFLSPRIAKHLHNFTACRPPHQRIIDDDDPFPFQDFRHSIELDLDIELADRLLRLNKGAADVVIPNQPKFKRNPRPLGIAK